MSEPEPAKRLQPKLMTKGKFVLLLGAVLVGASLGSVREYRAKGSVSTVTLVSSIAAFVVGLVILMVVTRYANKPEK